MSVHDKMEVYTLLMADVNNLNSLLPQSFPKIKDGPMT